MATIYFTRRFTRGRLNGIRHLDTISFATAERCLAWVARINRLHARGMLDYKIIDRAFQNYARFTG